MDIRSINESESKTLKTSKDENENEMKQSLDNIKSKKAETFLKGEIDRQKKRSSITKSMLYESEESRSSIALSDNSNVIETIDLSSSFTNGRKQIQFKSPIVTDIRVFNNKYSFAQKKSMFYSKRDIQRFQFEYYSQMIKKESTDETSIELTSAQNSLPSLVTGYTRLVTFMTFIFALLLSTLKFVMNFFYLGALFTSNLNCPKAFSIPASYDPLTQIDYVIDSDNCLV